MKSGKTKRHRRRRKALLCLAIGLGVLLSVLCVLSYGPMMTMASLTKVDDFPLYVMHYRGTYFFDLFAEEGIDWVVYRKLYEKVNPAACTSFAARTSAGALVAWNMDWYRLLLPYMLLLKGRPEGEPAFLAFALAGSVGRPGLSEHIAISANQLPYRPTETPPGSAGPSGLTNTFGWNEAWVSPSPLAGSEAPRPSRSFVAK